MLLAAIALPRISRLRSVSCRKVRYWYAKKAPEGMTPEVFSWDDASDNRFLASGVASWIHRDLSLGRLAALTLGLVLWIVYRRFRAIG